MSDPLRALRVAERSPVAVLAKDRASWLALFTEDAAIEDPVGAGAHLGAAARAKFWDVFIAPQRSVTFVPITDFVREDHVIRYVAIETVTPVAAAPFALRALVEYRVVGERVASLRAYWEPREAVSWHAAQGLAGLAGLARHGLRTTTGLGLGAATRFGLAMRSSVDAALAKTLAGALGRAHGGDLSELRGLVRGADLAIEAEDGTLATELDAAFGAGPTLEPIEVIRAGDHVAMVLGGEGSRLAGIARIEGGRVRLLRALREG